MEREIVVRGTGEARALPDLASLRVEVTADRKSQDEAYDARADLAAEVDAVFSQHANAIARTTVASLARANPVEDLRHGGSSFGEDGRTRRGAERAAVAVR